MGLKFRVGKVSSCKMEESEIHKVTAAMSRAQFISLCSSLSQLIITPREYDRNGKLFYSDCTELDIS